MNTSTIETQSETPKHLLNIMIDLETLGTKPGCKIISLSAVTFGSPITNYFDAPITVGTQDLLKTEAKTLDWWMTQSQEAQDLAFNNPNAITLVQALGRFYDWLDSLHCTPIIWGKGASFDAPVLTAAYEAYGIEVPWDFRNERCYRTLLAMFGHTITLPLFTGIKHSSLADATYQAHCAGLILDRLELIGAL